MDQAAGELQVLETQSLKITKRDEIAASWRYLLANKKLWSQRYTTDLMTAFIKAAEHKPAETAAASTFEQSGPMAFGLVDDSALTQAIDAQRLLQNLLPSVEQTLSELNALVSSALGLGSIMPERNPMKPEVFTQVLQSIASRTLDDSAAAARSFKVLAKPLGHELGRIYADTIKTLKQASIPAASYQLRHQPSAPTSAPMSAASSRSMQPDTSGSSGFDKHAHRGQISPSHSATQDAHNGFTSNPADLADLNVKNGLMQDFLSGHVVDTERYLAAPYYDDIEQELAALKAAPHSAPAAFDTSEQSQLARMPVVDRPQRMVNSTVALSEQVWGPYGTSRARALVRSELKKEATKVSQVLGLDVVRELVNQVAQDPRLLTPVRESIVALEPSLLRLALVDPRFFSDERHPARQLMERVAQRSFKYNDEFGEEFTGFFSDISHGFNQLNASPVTDAQPFSAALAHLERKWNTLDQQDFDKRQQVLQALRFAEERQTSADHIAFELSSRSDLQQVPGNVLDFLFGPWALVLAHARLADDRNQIDPGGYGSLVPDLVWSVKHDVTLKQPAKLIEMIPGLLEKLHSGLALLGLSANEKDDFFDSLMTLHRPVLKLRRLKSQRDAEESSAALLEAQEAVVSPAERLESLRAQSDAPLWLGRHELDAAGFEDTQPTQPADLTMLISAAQPSQPQAPNIAGDPEDQPAQAVQQHVPTEPQTREQAGEHAAAVLRSLKTGSWVDLYSKHQWLRAQLVWASTKATLFMFISHGGRPHSMTQRSCEKLIAQRLLRPINSHGVVAQALDGVADAAAAQSLASKASRAAKQAEAQTAW